MKPILTREVNHVEQLWNDWEIRVATISSLALQILLLVTAGSRKRNYGMTFQPIIITFSLWLEYLLADYVATFALGYLSRNQDENNQVLVFWAPFLLLHLGGQDTITALSIEDNELWKRHLLNFGWQVALAIYVFAKLPPPISITCAAGFIFAAGVLKYAERIWALQRASMSSLRSSMVTDPDPGPNYAKFMEEYYSSIAAGLDATIDVVPERREESGNRNETTLDLSIGQTGKDLENPTIKINNADVVCKAYDFFQTFKRLFVDLILSFEDRKGSQDYFIHLETKEAYKVIEIELFFMYDILHTKASVIHNWYGWFFRFTTLTCTISALVIFTMSNKIAYNKIEVNITYLLLVGAVLLEISAILFMLLSFWTYAPLKNSKKYSWLSDPLFFVIEKLWAEKKFRWSNSMAQYSLINYALMDKPNCMSKTMKFFGIKEHVDNFRYTTNKPVGDELKNLVFIELQKKTRSIVDAASYKIFSSHRGQWALQRKGYFEDLGWSIEAELDESILIWHIATDLLFHSYGWDKNQHDKNGETKDPCYPCISQHISNYMLFLLIARPFMLPAGIGQIRFGDTCAEAKKFFRRKKGLNHEYATKMILSIKTEYDPKVVKGDRSKSVLFDGCKLAHQLEKLYPKESKMEKMWRLISVVWVEMLCYAASKCGGYFHAKQLSKGGELLTHVWFLMAHLGMGEQYRIEAGHARAKLIVQK